MDQNSNIWYLEKVDLYEMLCPHKFAEFKDRHTFNKFDKGEFIYLNDEPSTHIFMIAKGRVKIGSYSDDGKEIIKTILSEGEIFGELSLTGEETRGDFAQAMDSETTVCPMPLEDMQQLLLDNKNLSLKIFKIIGLRMKKLERRLESLVFKDARSRIIDFLYEMGVEKGQKVGFEMMIKNHLTHKDIANLTGTSRQTVTTILNELKEKNLINFNRRQILIRDMEKLKDSAMAVA
ncbi:MAG TPA: Crp/Fnr family transcriptional regulator [Cytophagales bacterium]|nr:Crp/Fnr family transcriptional regulator [Cytophagales bacterium]HAA18307.1 Crp/Fnr family transcriptional regulator [Cytophagales bacterium]HAP63874.1 Crp/Fnr family transcriptional regulator [Cytophagales bacterium]